VVEKQLSSMGDEKQLLIRVGVTGFERATLWSQSNAGQSTVGRSLIAAGPYDKKGVCGKSNE
jgi:hypothetical protein